jgi:putative peptidoglycan lipid II flippase
VPPVKRLLLLIMGRSGVRLRLVLAFFAGLAMILAFLTQWAILVLIGPGLATDALFAAMAVPQLVLAVVTQSLMHVLVPLLSSEDEEAARRDTSSMIILVTIGFTAVAIVLFFLAPFWAPLLFPGLAEPGARALLLHLVRIQLIAMVLTASVGVLLAAYHARKRFLWVELTNMVASGVVLGLMFLTIPRWGIVAAAWLMVCRPLIQLALTLPLVGWPAVLDIRSPNVREAWRRVKPLLVGTSYYKTDPLLDRMLSTLAPAGGLSLLYFGQQLFAAVNGILNKAIAVPLVPQLAQAASAGDWKLFRSAFRRNLMAVALITCVTFSLFLLVGHPLLHLVIGRGGVTPENVQTLFAIMAGLFGVYIGGALGQVTSVAFYAMGDTRTPTRIGIITFTFYIPLKVGAFFYAGLLGLAIATSSFVIVNVLLQLRVLTRKFAHV